MHIALVTGGYRSISGIFTHVRDLSHKLVESRQRVTVFAPDVQAGDSREILQFVRVFDIPFIPQLLFYFVELIRCHLTRSIDVIHVHDSIAFPAAFYFGKIFRIKTVFTLHVSIFDSERQNIYPLHQVLLFKWASRFVGPRADMTICATKAMLNYATIAGTPKERIVYIPNPVDLKLFSRETEPWSGKQEKHGQVCLFVGVLKTVKGVEYLIRVIPEVRQRFPDVRCVIVGDGPLYNELSAYARSLGVGDCVEFVGQVPYEELSKHYQQADLFVLPSLSEGVPLVVIQAMACCLPVVASDVGGIPEVVSDQHNGLLVPPGDTESLARTIIHILSDRVLLERFSCNALQTAQKFSWEENIKEFITLYKELLNTEM